MKTIQLIVICLTIGAVKMDRIVLRTSANETKYSLFPLASDYFEFSVKAKNDVTVLLSNTYDRNSGFYEVVIGAFTNTKAIIRKDNNDIRAQFDGPTLNPDGYQSFWVKLDRTVGQVLVGRVGSQAFMNFADPEFVSAAYVGLLTGWGSDGEWNFDLNMVCKNTC